MQKYTFFQCSLIEYTRENHKNQEPQVRDDGNFFHLRWSNSMIHLILITLHLYIKWQHLESNTINAIRVILQCSIGSVDVIMVSSTHQ